MKKATFSTEAEKKKRVADAVLIFALLLVGGAAFLVLRLTAKSGTYVKVTADGNVTYVSLAADSRTEIVGYRGGTDVLIVEDGCAYFAEASCPDHLCIRTGKIRRVGESIICLPNRVSAEIVGRAEADFVQ